MADHEGGPEAAAGGGPEPDRRTFLGAAAGLTMAGGLAAGYGAFAAAAGRYLYPARRQRKEWLFVADLGSLPVGGSMTWTAPDGARIVIARRAEAAEPASFSALSSTCPHLGCQVHWESVKGRFFCPCHNGVFDPEGRGTEGPPKGMALARYPLRVERRLLFIEVPVQRLSADAGAGRDGCLRDRGGRA
ncbi:MAG: Rieske (2Fe-2S) protein [Planctomycetes bacterium]|nr:Rieske (2Fe-2S) protein [Planctomycetota bacterium]